MLTEQQKTKSLTIGDECEESFRQRAAEREGEKKKDQPVIKITVMNGGKRPLGEKSRSSIVPVPNHC